MKRMLLVILALLAGPSLTAKAVQSDSLRSHIDSALHILKSHSLYAGRVNWKTIEQRVHRLAMDKKTKAETFTALQVAFDALGDKHAAFYHYNNQYRIDNSTLNERYSDSLKAEWKKGPKISSTMLDRVAYLRIPYIGANTQHDIDKMAGAIAQAVSTLSKNHPIGWLIDLRLAAGGNIRPMMAGLGAFFSDGVLGYYLDRFGKAQDCASITTGIFQIDGKPQSMLKLDDLDLRHAKVAILIGPGTGSSAEGLAVNFHQRPHTTLIGQPTAGMANATAGYVFAGNQAYFLISVAKLADKHRKALPQQVQPDLFIAANEHFSDLVNDPTILAARAWLEKASDRVKANQKPPIKNKSKISIKTP